MQKILFLTLLITIKILSIMIYSKEILTLENTRVKQVNKNKAAKLWNEGKKIFLHPCNLRVNNVWQSPMLTTKSNTIKHPYYGDKTTFEQFTNQYKCYNCDSVRGQRVLFFAEL